MRPRRATTLPQRSLATAAAAGASNVLISLMDAEELADDLAEEPLAQRAPVPHLRLVRTGS